MRPALAALWTCALLQGCASQSATHTDGGADAGPIENPELTALGTRDGGCNGAGCTGPLDAPADKLDLLFIIDNSSSMREEQAALAKEFPAMIRKLISGDHDGDGQRDHQPVTDLHIGVVSSDMGADSGVRGCEGLGDDGLLLHVAGAGREPDRTCQQSYPTFLRYQHGAPEVAQLSNDFACIALLGTAGCGFEQHLESALKALWPASRPELTFLGLDDLPTPGHGDRENAGFLRTGEPSGAATLAIVAIADEDDCSSSDRAIFDPDTAADAGSPYRDQPLNLRCHLNHDKAYPLERYLYGFRNLGSRRTVFAGIVGVPVDLVDAAARREIDFRDDRARDAYYDRVLDDPRMQEQLVQPDSGGVASDLVPACHSALGLAYPARRFVELAKRFGRDSLIQSICSKDFAAPIDQVVDRVTAALE